MLFLAFAIIAGRLFQLQIIYGAKNRETAEGNRIRRVVIPAPRGIIYDSADRPLTRNLPVYRLINGLKTISRDEALALEAEKKEENFRIDLGRDYVFGRSLSSLLGYLGEVNEKEIGTGKGDLGDFIGRTGIEEKYEEKLRGTPGGELTEVDTSGKVIRVLGRQDPVAGEDIYLTIDARLSEVAYSALEGKKGAVVAINPHSGAVLALVSSPGFDPNKISSQELADASLPFFNRAISGAYPPGSIFKIITTTAGFEEGKLTRQTEYTDIGFIQIGDYIYKNWYFSKYGKGEGAIDVVRALKRSTDTFFYKVGEWVGPDKLAFWAQKYGLGSKTGIDLNGEVEGLVPNPEWKEKTTGERWFLGNTYHMAIGQGDLLATPVQIARLTGVVGSKGMLCQPYLLAGEESRCQSIGVKAETLSPVIDGMKEACSPGGTAAVFNDFQPQVGCKTGTAEFGLSGEEGKTHAWFTVFAPVEKPQIVVSVLIEGGGEGSVVSAPVAKKVLEVYFGNQ